MTHEEVNGMYVGKHPLVSCFLKGVFNSCPPVTWDVDLILLYFKSLSENQELSFQALSHKFAELMGST